MTWETHSRTFLLLLVLSISPASHADPEPGWCELQSLRDTYEEAKDTTEAAYIHQYLCMLERSCEEYRQNGDQGWAYGFVDSTFSYQSSLSEIQRGIDMECLPAYTQVQCFRAASGVHGVCELGPSFTNYCNEIVDSEDSEYEEAIRRWTQDHDLFLANAFDPCFQEIIDSGELPRDEGLQFKAAYRTLALGARKAAQVYCEEKSSAWGLLGLTVAAIEGMNDNFMCKK